MNSKQLDFFIPIVGDVPTKDQQDIMSYPCFSLSKNKRTEPIKFQSGENMIEVWPDGKHGMAQIWDADILIYFTSLIKHMQKRGMEITFPLKFRGNDLLAFVGRPTNDLGYERLRNALSRLRGTTIRTNIRVSDKRSIYQEFSMIYSWKEKYRPVTDPKTGKKKKISDGFEVELPEWFVEGVLEDKFVLTITQEYFQITSGIGRWLYRLCRKHCGKQTQWSISLRGLHQRSGTINEYRDFKRKLKKVVEDGIPQYDLIMAEVEGIEKLLVFRDQYQPMFASDKVIACSKPKNDYMNP